MGWVAVIGALIIGCAGWAAARRRANAWSTSERANVTRLHQRRRVTVFQADGGWKFCIADTDRDDSIHFSDPYPAEAAAKIEAIVFIEGRARKFQTNREIRLEAVRKGASEMVENEAAQQIKLEQTASKARSRIPRPTALALAKLRMRLADQAEATSSLHAELIAARACDDSLSKAEIITARYWDMCGKIDVAIKDISGAFKSHGPGL